MFKVPEWGEDVPNVKVNFDKKTKKPNKQQTTNIVNSNKPNQAQFNANKSPQNAFKEKRRKNKKQATENSATFTSKNLNLNGPKFVSTKINGDVNRNVNKNKKHSSKNGRTDNYENKSPNFKKKFNKRINAIQPNIDTHEFKEKDNVSVPKKGKKRKKQTKNNAEAQHENGEMSNAKKTKMEDNFKIDDQDLLFGHNNKAKNENKKKKDVPVIVNKKKERLKQLLETQMKRTPIHTSGNKLRDRMLERLKSAQFRYINEKLYTSSGSDAQQLFQNDPAAFQTYHEGYQQQVKKWPVNPLDVIVKRIQKMPKTHLIADMGCGEAALSKRIPHTVRSFDLVATTPAVEVCDVAHTPLLSASMDVAVYCLALMGTNLTQYLVEANRVLKLGGYLLIAEVESRFNKVEDFTKEVERLGFKLKNVDKTYQVFFFMEFIKIRDPPAKKSKLPILTLKPCLYKKR